MRALSITMKKYWKKENVLFHGAIIFDTECSHGIHINQRNAVMETEIMEKIEKTIANTIVKCTL